MHRASYAAGDVQLFFDDAVPQPLAGGKERLIPGQPGHIRHARVEVARPHRVAHGLLLLPHGLVGLIIGVALLAPGRRGLALICSPLLVLLQKVVGGRAPLVQEKLAQPPVALLSGGLIQPSQGHFRNLMPGVALAFLRLRAEAGVHTIGKPAGGAEQLILTRGLIVGHGSLYQMAQAV